MTLRDGEREIWSRSPAETHSWGLRLGQAAQGGEIIGLVGELGVGKTCLVRGIAAGLGISPEEISSPSFTMIAEYVGRVPFFHIDLYRLEGKDIDEMWLREYLFSTGVAVVEWYDRLPPSLREEGLTVRLSYHEGDTRRIEVEGRGEKHTRLLGLFLHPTSEDFAE